MPSRHFRLGPAEDGVIVVESVDALFIVQTRIADSGVLMPVSVKWMVRKPEEERAEEVKDGASG